MEALLAHLTDAVGRTRERVRDDLAGGGILVASDDDLVRGLALAAELQRLTDAVLIEAVGEIDRRSVAADRDLRMTSRYGCHDVGELVQRATLAVPATVARLRRAAADVRVGVSLAQEPMPAPLPAMREALLDGAVGLDGLLAVGDPLRGLRRRAGRDDYLAADGSSPPRREDPARTGDRPRARSCCGSRRERGRRRWIRTAPSPATRRHCVFAG